jgi:hypothetical protein
MSERPRFNSAACSASRPWAIDHAAVIVFPLLRSLIGWCFAIEIGPQFLTANAGHALDIDHTVDRNSDPLRHCARCDPESASKGCLAPHRDDGLGKSEIHSQCR